MKYLGIQMVPTIIGGDRGACWRQSLSCHLCLSLLVLICQRFKIGCTSTIFVEVTRFPILEGRSNWSWLSSN